jgi:hypothetical protein
VPYYDHVLGAHLDGELGREIFSTAVENDDDRSADDRRRVIDELVASGARAEIALEGDEGDRTLLVIADTEIRHEVITDSREATRVVRPTAAREPTIRAKSSASIDDIVGALEGATEDELSADAEDSVSLPFRWRECDAVVHAFAAVGAQLRGTLAMLLEIDGRRYELAIDKTHVTCSALHSVARSPDIAARFDHLAKLPAWTEPLIAPLAKAPKPTKRPPFDPDRPLVTGTAALRSAAFHEIDLHHRRGHRIDELVPRVCEAVRDPANAERPFAKMRVDIYHLLAKHDTDEVAATFEHALRTEDDTTVETVIYIGWKLDLLIARLPALIADADARGDKRTAGRMKRLQREAG